MFQSVRINIRKKSRIANPETLAALGTYHTARR